MNKDQVLDFEIEEVKQIQDDDPFSRQKLIKDWDQDKVKNAKVLVVGAGALGNEVLKNLALLGVGQIFIVDFDEISKSNLSRTVLYRMEDNGKDKAVVCQVVCKISDELVTLAGTEIFLKLRLRMTA